MIDLRFATALQVMLNLALAEAEGVPRLSSTQLAESAAANPSFVRKLLAPLSEAGLIESAFGRSGGVALARPASEISLDAVYRSVMGDKRLWASREDVPHRCVVSSNLDGFLECLADEADTALLGMLSKKTLASSLDDLRARQSA